MTAFRTPWEDDPAPAEAEKRVPGPALAPQPKPRGRRPAASRVGSARSHPAWLYHHLTITGPADAVEAFAAAARGSGVTPWQLDGAALEEDVFNLAAAQPPARRRLSIEGCRILARQVRDRVEARQARAAALVGQSRACPFDLHTLLPVPAAVLQLGPNHPKGRGVAAGELGHGGHAAAHGRAARCTAGPPAAAGPCRDRLRVLHRGRYAARCGLGVRRALADAALRAAATSGLRRGGRHRRSVRGRRRR